MNKKYNILFKKYSSGDSSVKEEKVVETYFNKKQESGISIDEVTEVIGDRVYSQVEQSINRKRYGKFYKIAVSVAAILILGAIVIQNLETHFNTPSTIKIVADLGEQKRIILPDSSLVYLNSGSTIEYPQEFSTEKRSIKLTGEAYFDVVHKDAQPFIISSDNFKTQVLGTRFVVSNYLGETPAVTVVSGKVQVTDPLTSNYEIIVRNQRVTYNAETKNLNREEDVNATNYMVWKDGRIFFSHATIEQVIKTLHKRFDVTIDVTTPYYNCKTISGNFSDADIETILKSIQFINDMKYTIHDHNSITITLTPCKQ